MSAPNPGLWYMLVSIVHTMVQWLDKRFSRKAKRIKDADAMLKEGLKEKDGSKVQAALDRLLRMKK